MAFVDLEIFCVFYSNMYEKKFFLNEIYLTYNLTYTFMKRNYVCSYKGIMTCTTRETRQYFILIKPYLIVVTQFNTVDPSGFSMH